jgi:hypothetical protein
MRQEKVFLISSRQCTFVQSMLIFLTLKVLLLFFFLYSLFSLLELVVFFSLIAVLTIVMSSMKRTWNLFNDILGGPSVSASHVCLPICNISIITAEMGLNRENETHDRRCDSAIGENFEFFLLPHCLGHLMRKIVFQFFLFFRVNSYII